jgi:hypothetical protein
MTSTKNTTTKKTKYGKYLFENDMKYSENCCETTIKNYANIAAITTTLQLP